MKEDDQLRLGEHDHLIPLSRLGAFFNRVNVVYGTFEEVMLIPAVGMDDVWLHQLADRISARVVVSKAVGTYTSPCHRGQSLGRLMLVFQATEKYVQLDQLKATGSSRARDGG